MNLKPAKAFRVKVRQYITLWCNGSKEL